MNRRNHKWYGRTYSFNEWLNRKLTPHGAGVFITAFTLTFFGLNTNVSSLYIIFSIAVALLLTDMLSLIFRMPDLKVTRYLPAFASKNLTVNYRISVRNGGSFPDLDGFFMKEMCADPRPDYDTFISTPEPGEEKRNRYDRRMAYYRWKWLVDRNTGAEYEEVPVKGEYFRDEMIFSASFKPQRRGRIRLSGIYIYRKGVFGLCKRGRVFEIPGEIIILPEIRPVVSTLCINGSMNSSNEKVRETPETGTGYELKALREYLPGDSPRSIHWKSSAKTGQLKIKEFHREVDAGTVMFIDNFFTESYLEDFESLLSVAASMLNHLYETDRMPQGLIIGSSVLEITDVSKDILMKALSLTALAQNDPAQDMMVPLMNLTERVKECCSVIFLTPLFDEKRYSIISSLVKNGVPVSVIYTGERKASNAVITTEKGVSAGELNKGGLQL